MPTKFQSSLTAQEIENRLVNANTNTNKNFNDQLLIKHIEVSHAHAQEKTLLTIISEPFINDNIVELINTTNLVRICIPRSKGASRKHKSYFKRICPNSFYYNSKTSTEEIEHSYVLDSETYSGLTEEEFLEKNLIFPITSKNLKINKDKKYYITYTININNILQAHVGDLDYDFAYDKINKIHKNPESTNNDIAWKIEEGMRIFDSGNKNESKRSLYKHLNQQFFHNLDAYRRRTVLYKTYMYYHPQTMGLNYRETRNDKITTYSKLFAKKGKLPIYHELYSWQYDNIYNGAVETYSEQYPWAYSDININKKWHYKQYYNTFCFAILKENYNQEWYYMFDKKYKYFSKKLCHKCYLGVLGASNYGILKHTFWLK